MKKYQLRFPKGSSMQDLVDEVTWAIWKGLSKQPGLEGLRPHAFVSFHRAVRMVLEAHVVSYHLCGATVKCQAGTIPGPWMEPDDPVPAREATDWYILEVKKNLKELVREISDGVLCVLIELTGDTMLPVPLEPLVEQALRLSLGEHLYQNPVCGEMPVCHEALKLNPWAGVPV